MAKVGRGNKAIDELPAELRAAVDARVDLGHSAKAIYEEMLVDQYMSLRTLQEYVTDRRRELRLQIARDERALLDGMLELAEVDHADLTRVQRITLGTVLKEMMTGGKATTRLNAVDAVLAIRKDRRKEEEHELKMRLGRMRDELERKAAANAEETGQKMVSIEEIAKIMEQIEVGGQAA